MTPTLTDKEQLKKLFFREFGTIERAFNNRRKKNRELPSLMKDGFVNPIALKEIEAMYGDNAKEEAVEAIRSDDKIEKLEMRILEIRTLLNECKAENANLNLLLAEADRQQVESLDIIYKLQTDVKGFSDTVLSDLKIISELQTEKSELQNLLSANGSELLSVTEMLSEVQTELQMLQKKGQSFVQKFKSDSVTIVGLLFSILYQGFHSQKFFYDRYAMIDQLGNNTIQTDDWKNMMISTCAAIAFSVAGFKLTLHTKSPYWIYGIASIDFLIYCTPKSFNFANILAGFAVAVSIVAYSHILNGDRE